VSEYPPPTPGGSSQPTTPRGPRKAKPLLAAAAASKTPTQRGTLREREKLKQKERAEREKEKLAQTPTSMRFTPSHSPAPGTPTASWFPPAVSTPRSELGMPPSVVSSDFPPSVASTAPVAQDDPASSGSTPDPAALAAALATIREDPAEASTSTAARKRQPRKKAVTTAAATADVDMDEAPSSPKRRRQSRPRQSRAGPIRADGEGEDEGESDVSDLADEDYVESGSDGGGGDASKAKRARRGTYKSAGRAGTTKDRRTSAFRRQATIAAPELTGVQANELVGEEVNPAIIRLGDLATSLAAQGRVSARTIKLANFQRSEEERKLRERATKTENNWRRRQIVRRKARELRNAKRAERREAVAAAGENEGAISDDEPDSEEDYEIEPDRLTPPGSPRKADRVAPVSFEPLPVVAAEGEEGEGSGSGAVRAPHGDVEFEDIEGLGFVHQPGGEEDEEMGETLEDFQLPVEDDGEPEAPHDPEAGMDISGLEANDYSGGYLDDEGNWVEGGTMNRAALLHQRNEEHRRRILDGDHGQTVEVIDNETQFVNSATWGKKVSNDRWTAEETELFFAVSCVVCDGKLTRQVLRETGENYTLMKAYFPGRSVRQLKNKGSRENRVNTQRMTDAIMNRKPMGG
jgi:transcription factor TFIIIB component B''